MKRLPIKQGYTGYGVTLYYNGEYMVINTVYHLFFIANSEGVVYDTLLLEDSAVEISSQQIKTVKGEVFNRI